jgi:hypothetical protein
MARTVSIFTSKNSTCRGHGFRGEVSTPAKVDPAVVKQVEARIESIKQSATGSPAVAEKVVVNGSMCDFQGCEHQQHDGGRVSKACKDIRGAECAACFDIAA